MDLDKIPVENVSKPSEKKVNKKPTRKSRRQYYQDNMIRDYTTTTTSSPATKDAIAEEMPGKDEEDAAKVGRLAKRKVALLLSYCGTGYQGMQMYSSPFNGIT